MLNVLILVKHCLGHLSNIERRGQGGRIFRDKYKFTKVARCPRSFVRDCRTLIWRGGLFFRCSVFIKYKITVNNERKRDTQNNKYVKVSSCCSFAALHFRRLYLSSTASGSLVAVVLIFGFALASLSSLLSKPNFYSQ